MVYQASPFQTQTPAFSSPLDQLVNGNGFPSGPSTSRGALLNRAFSLTRGGPPSRYEHSVGRNPATVAAASPSFASSKSSGPQTFSHEHAYDAGTTAYTYDASRSTAQALQQRSMNAKGGLASASSSTTNREKVQRLREVRLSQQQDASSINLDTLSRQRANISEGPPIDVISTAFRDSIASDISFNSITGAEERRSDTMRGYGYAEQVSDGDRIAQEVRGLAMRRRPSMDTVRSSEFGDGGRWAKAWAGSDDGEDDKEEDEMDLQAMRARDLDDLDVEGRSTPLQHVGGLGALGELGSLQGARAAMSLNGRSDVSTNPQLKLHNATASAHAVHLTPSHQMSQETRIESGGQYASSLSPNPTRSRRDTITSVAGEIGDFDLHTSSSTRTAEHARSPSNATVTTLNSTSANDHVKVWPPTPAGSDLGSSHRHAAQGGSRQPNVYREMQLTRPGPGTAVAQSAIVEDSSSLNRAQRGDHKPLSPSSLLSQPTSSSNVADGQTERVVRTSNGVTSQGRYERYGDPNEPAFSNDALGKFRRRAIAEHDGRESLVSDLDVETLRLDGSSTAGSGDEWASRRDSTSTIGTVSSIQLDEQRRRRSRMEHRDVSAAGFDDRRTSTATIRGAESLQRAPQNPLNSSESVDLKRNASQPSPVKEKSNPFHAVPPAPKRSNTLPEEHQVGTPHFAPAPWAAPSQVSSSAGSLQLASPTPSRHSIGAGPTAQPKRASGGSSSNVAQSQAEKFLTLGIAHHESGDLSRSAYYFERSAKVEGGCVVGMCMWGMALREGWGVRKDQKRGFEWISRAASRAGEMMSGRDANTVKGSRTEAELKAIRSELKLSVYELGKCFCYGWGVKMDKQMALEYFELAAKLGDSDAQAEAGALLAAGKGCKKDLKKAAMYYRLAEAQGYDTVGLSWIHKDKYDPQPGKEK